MGHFYERTRKADSPVKLADVKSYLKVTTTADDDLLSQIINAATDFAEKYTGREFRKNTWKLFLDVFETRICLRKDPVLSITSVKRLVSGTLTAVASSVYYLKKSQQFSEILLNDGESWPDDEDNREHAIQVVFLTEALPCLDEMIVGIYRHVAFLYENRGDCDPIGFNTTTNSAVQSGATIIYDQARIVRV